LFSEGKMATGSSKKTGDRQGSKDAQGQKNPPTPTPAPATPEEKGALQKLLDGVGKVGNKAPHPVLMFFYLMIGVIVLSAALSLLGISVTEQIAVPAPVEVTPDFYEDVSQYTLSGVGAVDVKYVIQEQTITINSLLSIEGIRFLFTSFVPNFQSFSALAVTLIAMMGAGAAEVAGLLAALIRRCTLNCRLASTTCCSSMRSACAQASTRCRHSTRLARTSNSPCR